MTVKVMLTLKAMMTQISRLTLKRGTLKTRKLRRTMGLRRIMKLRTMKSMKVLREFLNYVPMLVILGQVIRTVHLMTLIGNMGWMQMISNLFCNFTRLKTLWNHFDFSSSTLLS